MKRVTVGVFTLVVQVIVLSAGAAESCHTFSAYPAEVYGGPYVEPDYDSYSSIGARFRTAIRDGYSKNPDFAGHFEVVSRGCGSGCQQNVLIDTRYGLIVKAPSTTLGAGYRVDSALFVVNPDEKGKEAGASHDKTLYYLWVEEAYEFRQLGGCVE